MFGFRHVGLSAMMWLGFLAGAQAADTPLCSVHGLVTSIQQEEMNNTAQKKHVLVPVIVLDITELVPADASYTGDFCDKAAPAAAGGKRMGYFRLCDAVAEFMVGQTITGVVGTSQGGGRLCLAQIQVQLAE